MVLLPRRAEAALESLLRHVPRIQDGTRARVGLALKALQMKPEDAAWLAAVIDAEGSIFESYSLGKKGKKYPHPVLVVYNTSAPFLEKAGRLMDEKPHFAKRIYSPFSRKLQGSVRAYGSNLAPILRAVIPYLIIKKDQAEKILALIESRPWGPKGLGRDSHGRYLERRGQM